MHTKNRNYNHHQAEIFQAQELSIQALRKDYLKQKSILSMTDKEYEEYIKLTNT